MYAFSKVLVVLSVALSVAASPSHSARSPHNHRDLAARIASPEPAPEAPVFEERDGVTVPRRSRKQRDETASTELSTRDGALTELLNKILNGDGTFYATGLGACGVTNNDGDMIAAASHALFDSFPGADPKNTNKNPICHRGVNVNYKGKNVKVKITDRCEACEYGSLDFSPSAFNKLSDPSAGRIKGISWKFD